MISSESTVFVVDGAPEARRDLQALVEEMGLRCDPHPTAASFLDAYCPNTCGCIVMEVILSDLSGLHLQQRLTSIAQPPTPVIFCTAHATVRTAVSAMRSGALHFLEKPMPTDELREAIYEGVLLDQEGRQARRWQQQLRARLNVLTSKEGHVLELLGEGNSSREIAEQLAVSIRTVELRRSKLMKKLGVKSLAELERIARQVGFLDGTRRRDLRLERLALSGIASGTNSVNSFRI